VNGTVFRITYAGGPSSHHVVLTVVATFSTTTALTAQPATTMAGQSVTLTATVSGQPSSTGTPTGTVTFFDGATSIGTGTLNASGVATLTTNSLSVGTHSLTATYGGDLNFAGSTSAPATETVTALPVPAAGRGPLASDAPLAVALLMTGVLLVTGARHRRRRRAGG
jgi:hypothetical protein